MGETFLNVGILPGDGGGRWSEDGGQRAENGGQRLKTTDYRPPTTDHRLPTTDNRLPTRLPVPQAVRCDDLLADVG